MEYKACALDDAGVTLAADFAVKQQVTKIENFKVAKVRKKEPKTTCRARVVR
jgi:hypothetical protein